MVWYYGMARHAITLRPNHGLFVKSSDLVKEPEVEGMPLPAAIDSLREEVIGLTAQLSEVSAALTRKNEDLLITNQDLLDLKETLVTQQTQQGAMTAQHSELVEKITASDELAIALQKEVAVLNGELAGAQGALTEQADAAASQDAVIETMQGKLDSAHKQLAHFQELYELATTESSSAKKAEQSSELELNEFKVQIAEQARLQAKSALETEDLTGQIGILEATVARLENELGVSAEGGKEMEAARTEILTATREKALASEAMLMEQSASLETATGKVTQLEMELADARAGKDQAEKRLETAVNAQREAASADSAASSAKLLEVQTSFSAFQDDLNILGFATVQQVKEELKSLRAAIAAATETAEATQLAHASQLREELAAQKAGFDAEAVGLAAKVGDAKKEKAFQAVELADLEEKVRVSTAKIATLEAAAAAAAAEGTATKAALAAATVQASQLAGVQAEAAAASSELQALKKAHAVQAGKVASLESSLTLTQASATRAQEKIASMSSSQEGALGSAIASATAAEDKFSAQTAALMDAKERQATADGKMKGLTASVAAAEAAAAEAGKKVRILEMQQATLKQELATKEFEYKEALASAGDGGVNDTTAFSEKLREAVIKLAMSEARVQEMLTDEREAAVEAEQRELGMAQLQASLAKQKAANSELAATLRKALASQ